MFQCVRMYCWPCASVQSPVTTSLCKSVLPKTKTPDEWTAFFGCIQTRYPTAARNHAMLYLTYMAGLRIGETLALRVHDVDLDLLWVHCDPGQDRGADRAAAGRSEARNSRSPGGCRSASRGQRATCSLSPGPANPSDPAPSGAPWPSTA